VPPRARKDKVLRNGYTGSRVWKPDPQGGLSAWASQGAQTSHPSWEEVQCRHVPLWKQPLNL
jgi:hypothetical protein